MTDLEKQVCRCIVGACDETCQYYNVKESCCDGYCEVAEQSKKTFDEYKDYKTLEEQNRLLKLPVAVGSVVYTFSFCNVLKMRVECFIVYKDHIEVRITSESKENPFLTVDIDIAELGKRWFLTEYEATVAIQRLKEKT